jgi:hypothetical protein
VAFLDSDDLWRPSKIDAQIRYVAEHPDCHAVFTAATLRRPDGSEEEETAWRTMDVEDFLSFPCPLYPSAIMMDRAALIEAGLFDPTRRVCEDVDLFLRFCRATGEPIHYLPESLVIRHIDIGGLSSNLRAWWRHSDGLYRKHRAAFTNQARCRRVLHDVSIDCALRGFYRRDVDVVRECLTGTRARAASLARSLGGWAARALRARVG